MPDAGEEQVVELELSEKDCEVLTIDNKTLYQIFLLSLKNGLQNCSLQKKRRNRNKHKKKIESDTKSSISTELDYIYDDESDPSLKFFVRLL